MRQAARQKLFGFVYFFPDRLHVQKADYNPDLATVTDFQYCRQAAQNMAGHHGQRGHSHLAEPQHDHIACEKYEGVSLI